MKNNHITITIADTTCRIFSENNEFLEFFKDHFRYFISEKKEDFSLYIQVSKKSAQKNPDPYIDVQLHEFKISITDIKGSFFLSEKKGKFKIFGDFFNLIPVLKFCYSIVLLQKDYLSLHACLVEKKNKGIVFCGKSGSGKSTIAKLSSGSLCDEYILIKKIKNDIILYSTPLSQSMKCRKKILNLEKLFFIKKSDKNSITKMSNKNAWIEIMKNENLFRMGFYSDNPGLKIKIISLLLKIFRDFKFYQLEFKKDKTFWENIYKLEKLE
ncbi:hypothetical protein GF327_00020 [Candidatus Woesearchaeota archaeon]|nr:hypothetical protein [Candidatus Woesearchaeota archaeon]